MVNRKAVNHGNVERINEPRFLRFVRQTRMVEDPNWTDKTPKTKHSLLKPYSNPKFCLRGFVHSVLGSFVLRAFACTSLWIY